MHVSNKYHKETSNKRNGTRNGGYMGYTDLLETYLQNHRQRKLMAYLYDDVLDELLDD